jgi:hypothetical protein
MRPRSIGLLFLAWWAVGCAEPVQYGGPIAVDQAGLASRLRAACRAGALAEQGLCDRSPSDEAVRPPPVSQAADNTSAR